MPSRRPRRNRPLTNAQRVVRHHRLLGHFVHAPQSMTLRASAFRSVRRKRFRVKHRLLRRVLASPRVQHAEQVGQRRNAADVGPSRRRTTLLLQRHRRRQPVNLVHLRHTHLMKQSAGIRGDRFQISPLCLSIQRAECERRLTRPRHTREHHQRVARYFDVYVLKIMLASTPHPNEPSKPIRRTSSIHNISRPLHASLRL